MSTAANRADEGAALGPHLRLGGHPAQGQVPEEEHQQDRGAGEPGVPRPPHPPGRLSPDRPRDERADVEDDADLDGGRGQTVPEQRAGARPQIEEAGRPRPGRRRGRGPPRPRPGGCRPGGPGRPGPGRAASPTARARRSPRCRPAAATPMPCSTAHAGTLGHRTGTSRRSRPRSSRRLLDAGRRRPPRAPGRRRRTPPADGATASRPAGTPPAQRRLPDPGPGQQDRRGDREQQERQQRLADPQPGRQRAVERAGGGEPDRSPRTTGARRSARGSRSGPRRAGPRRPPSTTSSTTQLGADRRRLARGTARPGRGRTAAGRPGPRRPTRPRRCAGRPAPCRTAPPPRRDRGPPRPSGCGRARGRRRTGPGPRRRREPPGRGATRDRASIRRSLPATRRVSRHMGHPTPRPAVVATGRPIGRRRRREPSGPLARST